MADNYTEASTPKPVTAFDEANKAAARLIKPKAILYTSALLSWLQPFQSGWSTSQTNLSQYNDTDECNARPVAEDTCLMFPGHSKLEWTFAVNAWIFGAMIGSLCCGHFSDRLGRKKTLMLNCIFMFVGGVIEAAVSNIWAFAVGRLIAGVASGTATGTIGAYGRKEEAKKVIARLYGEEHVQTALSWLQVNKKPETAEEGLSVPKKESMFAPRYRMQLLGGILLSIFSDAGISDSRVGTLIIDFINIWPAFFTGVLANRFGARNMILWGLAGMFVMSVLMTVAFVVDVSALSIVFTALYVIAFGVTLGPLVWVMTADIFPDSIRASASSLCIGMNWLCNLIVGVSYPYISDALDDYAYVPFVVLLAIFFLLALKLVPETSGKSAEEILAEYDSRREN
eukprot:jgi/Phyca11/531556/estExt2_fgenesh1_pg.C_PHYCAscaffold_10175